MGIERERTGEGLHVGHAVACAACVPLFAGTLLSDIAYAKTYEIQWANFASWLLAGGLLLSGITLLLAVIGLVRSDRRGAGLILYAMLLLATLLLGFINSLVHAHDAWEAMPTGLILSVVVLLLAGASLWVSMPRRHAGAAS